MRYAIFSDIHNHLRNLNVVLRHAHQSQVDDFFCLGDIGDIGADRCVTTIRKVEAATVFGNWEILTWHHFSSENQQWALNLPPIIRQDRFWLTHAAPLWPENIKTLQDFSQENLWSAQPQLFPYLHYESFKLWQTIKTLANAKIPLLFHGHTHIQMGWRIRAADQLEKITAQAIRPDPHEITIIGVGSVGYPKDDSRPSYVIYDSEAKIVEMIKL